MAIIRSGGFQIGIGGMARLEVTEECVCNMSWVQCALDMYSKIDSRNGDLEIQV